MPDAAQQEQEQQFANEEMFEMGEQRITVVCGFSFPFSSLFSSFFFSHPSI